MNASKWFVTLLLLAPGLVTAAAAPPPSIGVSPARLEIVVRDKATTGSATVLNLSEQPVHVKTSLANFDLDQASNFRELPPESGSLSDAIMINPVEFTIPANSSQTVRFAIMPERLQGTGEHRAMLFFSELVDTSAASVKLNFRLGMPIYASVGEVQSLARFNEVKFEAEQNFLELDISAVGTAQVRPTGYYLWWPSAEFPNQSKAFARVTELARNPSRKPPDGMLGGRLVTKPVFPGTQRSVVARLNPPPDSGDYTLVFHLDAGGQQLQQAIEYHQHSI